ncbi:MAG: CHASE domain-containing protein [Thermoleophilia bacterium]
MKLRARTLVAGLALAGLALAAFAISSRAVDQRLDQERESRALEAATALTRALAAVDGDVRGVVGLFSTARDVDDFSLFAAPALRTPGLVALGWAPRVTEGERAQFEQRSGFGLTQLGPDGTLAPAEPRLDHFPIAFAAPLPRASAWSVSTSAPPGPRATRRRRRRRAAPAPGAGCCRCSRTARPSSSSSPPTRAASRPGRPTSGSPR